MIGSSGIAAREQPGRRLAYAPPLPQQLQEPRRQHAVAILLAFALLDAEHHALGVDIRHLEVGDLGHPQSGAIGNAERGLVLRPGRGLQEPQDFIRRQNHRQLLRLADQPQMARHVRSIAGRREKEPQRRHRTVHGRRLHALLALTNLERTQILPLGRVRRAAEEDCEVLNVTDVVALRLLAEAADRHVLDHAAAKRADGRRRAHWGAPGLEVEVA